VAVPVNGLKDLLTLKAGFGETQQIGDPRGWVDVAWPLELLQDGVELIDSPGLNEHSERDAISLGALPRADAVVVVLSAEVALSRGEQALIEKRLGEQDIESGVFFVWNRFDAIREDAEAVADLQARSAALLEPRLGKRAKERIFYVAAREGLMAKRSGDAQVLARSGLPALEDRLHRFLGEERGGVKLAGPARVALASARELRTSALPRRREDLGTPLVALEARLLEFSDRKHQLAEHRARINTILEDRSRRLVRTLDDRIANLGHHVRARAGGVAEAVEVGFFEASLFPGVVERRLAESLQSWLADTLRGWHAAEIQPLVDHEAADLAGELRGELSAYVAAVEAARVGADPGTALQPGREGPLTEVLEELSASSTGEGSLFAMLPAALGAAVTVGALAVGGPLAAAVAAAVSVFGVLTAGKSASQRAQEEVAARFVAELDAALPALSVELQANLRDQLRVLGERVHRGALALEREVEVGLGAALVALREGRQRLLAELALLERLEGEVRAVESLAGSILPSAADAPGAPR
jgi:hypothetical protein